MSPQVSFWNILLGQVLLAIGWLEKSSQSQEERIIKKKQPKKNNVGFKISMICDINFIISKKK